MTQHEAAGPGRTVLFDLDGVIARRDTFSVLLTRRLARRPHLLAPTLVALPAVAATLPAVRGRGIRQLVRGALLGASLPEVRAACAEVGAEFAATASWLHLDAVDLLHDHVARGDRVVVVTATATTLARALLDGLGLPAVDVLGSGLRADRWGVEMHPHTYGARKVVALREAGVAEPWTSLHTDSAADLPLVGLVDEVVLVNASAALTRLARRRAAGGRTRVRQVRWS